MIKNGTTNKDDEEAGAEKLRELRVRSVVLFVLVCVVAPAFLCLTVCALVIVPKK